MKRVIFVALTLLLASSAAAAQDSGLPELHQIKKVTLTPSYSCRSKEDFQKGYERTALTLASDRRGPDLLFNGACGSPDYFQAATAGDDMSLIADLGTGVNLEEVTAQRAFNMQGVHSFPAYTKFAQTAAVERNHTYVVLLNNSMKRGLFVFTVTGYIPNERVDLRYAVKEYQLLRGVEAQSPGFKWDEKNSAARTETFAGAVEEQSSKKN